MKYKASLLMKKSNDSASVDILKKLRQGANDLDKTSSLSKYMSESKNKKTTNQTSIHDSSEVVIHELDVADIIRWKYKDRPENELGDIKGLATSFDAIGQQVPCIVRPTKLPNEYELIAGERRWKAAELLGISLKCIIQNIDDKTSALIQAVENEKRQDISDYAKGMSYYEKIEVGILKQSDIIEILGISPQQVSRLLSFAKIPKAITEAIGDMSKVTARTAEEIRRLSNKGEDYINAIIGVSHKLASGEMGSTTLVKSVKNSIYSATDNIKSEKVYTKDNRHIFTIRTDNNKSPSIHFPNNVSELIKNGNIPREELVNKMIKLVNDLMKNI